VITRTAGAAVLLLMSVLLGGCFSHPTRTPAAIDPAVPHVSVMTFNVNFGLAGDPATLGAIARQDADVVFLQETTPRWESAIRAQCGADYPNIQFRHVDGGGGGRAGWASSRSCRSRALITCRRRLVPRRAHRADVADRRLQVLNVHLRPPISNSGSAVSGYLTTPPVREAEMSTFATALDKTLPTPDRRGFQRERARAGVRWLHANGFTSALPEFAPDAQTWRWRTSYIALSGRYDHLCYDARLTPLRVEVRNAGRSDHLPVVGVFALVTPAPTGTHADHGASPPALGGGARSVPRVMATAVGGDRRARLRQLCHRQPGPAVGSRCPLLLKPSTKWRERGNDIVDGFLIEYFSNPPHAFASTSARTIRTTITPARRSSSPAGSSSIVAASSRS
jgi:endonuclease/exonuclease/phosphatase family metal-dependent hydrolase